MSEQPTSIYLTNFESHPQNLADQFKEIESMHPEISQKIKSAQNIADLGCGEGWSTRAVLDICQDVKTVDTVDSNQTAKIETKAKHNHLKENMEKYLAEQPDESLDLITVFAVPDPFKDLGAYANLARVLRPGGIIITYGDTAMDGSTLDRFYDITGPRKQMKKNFIEITETREPFDYRIWQKKD